MWQVSKGLQILLSILVFVLVQIAFLVEEHHPFRGLFNAFMLMLVLFMGSWLSALAIGWYFDFWIPGLTGVGVVFAEKIGDALRDKARSPGVD
jgi:hypothetical protein